MPQEQAEIKRFYKENDRTAGVDFSIGLNINFSEGDYWSTGSAFRLDAF